MEMEHQKQPHQQASGNKHYKKLLLMTVLSFIAMYLLMYSMVDIFSNVTPNVNQFYMAGLMTMPMVIIELALMGGMYVKKKLNTVIFAASLIALVGFFLCIRYQVAVGDKQFLKGMIPHHAAALLMAKKANIKDPEIKKLTEQIILSQQAEIEQMKAKIKEIEK
ncbi:DUF305 domain-containing protein [Chitinophagaceae bacterium IBVUCB2]|nr:DUF305 domain-containing protein [Chitinophagaceae bacterium IBVUCB2]